MSEFLNEQELAEYPYNETGDPVRKDDPKYLAWKKVQEPGTIERELKEMGIDHNDDQLNVMMKMQKLFAKKFHEVEGLSKNEVEHWVEAYIDCVEDELSEVREHIPWQKGLFVNTKEVNVYELKKEVIDILHFVMDELIMVDVDGITLTSLFSDVYGVDLNTDNVLEAMLKYELEHHNGSKLKDLSTDEAMMQAHNYFHDAIRNTKQHIDWKHWKKKSSELRQEKIAKGLLEQWITLLSMFNILGMDSEEIYDIYVVKNVENVLRNRFGY